MITMDFRGDMSIALRAVDNLSDAVKGAATARALNRAATTVRAEARKEIRSRYNVTATRVNKILKLKNATATNPDAIVSAKDTRLALAVFGAKQSKRGKVTVKVLRTGARRVVKGNPNLPGKPFLATLKTGHVGIFQRTQAKRPYSKPVMKELFSVSIPGALVSKTIGEVLRRVAVKRFNEEFRRELQYRLSRKV